MGPQGFPILILDIRIGDSGVLYSMAGVGFVSRYSRILALCVCRKVEVVVGVAAWAETGLSFHVTAAP